MSGPLNGIKIVELGTYVAVPSAGAILSDWGAEVVKVEDPAGGDPTRTLKVLEGTHIYIWEQTNRNKQSVAVDLGQEQGREILKKLIGISDVLLTNFRSYILERWDLTYEKVSRINPSIVFASLTGYGPEGPDKDLPGYDHSAFWARSGIMHKLTVPGCPAPAQRSAMGDNVTSMLIAGAISAALLARERTGVGQEVDFSLYHTGVWTLNSDIHCFLHGGEEMPPADRTRAINPLRNIYRAKNGQWLQLVMPESDRYWPSLCKALGQEDLERDNRFDSAENRATNNTALIQIIDDIFANRNSREWVEIFKRHNLIYGLASTLTDVVTDPQAKANNFFAEFKHGNRGRIKLINSPAKFNKTPAKIYRPAPELGEHTGEVLTGLGYSRQQIDELESKGIVSQFRNA